MHAFAIAVLHAVPLVAAVPPPVAQEGGEIAAAAPIVEVAVYPDGAAVRRRAELPQGGVFRVEGLPRALDPDSVRVRAEGGHVVAVELRDRVLAGAADPRVRALSDEIAAIVAELAAIADAAEVEERVLAHLEALAQAAPPEEGAARDVAAWSEAQDYLRKRMLDARAKRRALARDERAARARLETLQAEQGTLRASAGVAVRDLIVDVQADAAVALDVDYLVPDAGWTPTYDLRASSDLATIEVVYRARVRQGSGEDWTDVELALSTARPSAGAGGPEPVAQWVGVRDPRRPAAGVTAAPAESARAGLDDADRFARVSDEGLSLRFRLPARETVRSGGAGTSVLVGRFDARLAAERVCVPAVDPGVWLRGRTTNASDYVLLPGPAAVYVGADYLGAGALETARPGEELVVPLGRDPGVTVERVQLLDRREREGVFRSRRVQREAWRVDLAAHASLTLGRGPVEVVVHESLPRATSDRIEVELERAEPALSKAERWARLREEKGVLTWVVSVPRGGAVRIEHEIAVESPEDAAVVRRIER